MKYPVLTALIFCCIFFSNCKKSDLPPPAPPKSFTKEIVSFSFQKDKNPALDADYTGTVSGTSVSVSIPYGMDITQLKASFVLSSKASAKVGSTAQSSGVTTNDFSNPVVYVITAEDNSTVNYTVTVNRSGISTNANLNSSTSFSVWSTNYVHTDLSQFLTTIHGGNYWGDEFAAQAFYDFDKDGDKDFICGSFNYNTNTAIDIQFYRNNGGAFTKDQTAFGATVPQFVHSRQIILGDFDKNGWMDVVFAAHGWDQSPFPGEQQKILLNNNGVFTAQNIPLPMSNGQFTYNHSVCAGDIDNDGDLDLFFTNNMRLAASGIFMLNSGNGTFTYDASVFPADLQYKPCFSSSLQDLDLDGYLDLIISGHDRDQNLTAEQGLKPTILWGNYTGKYSTSRKTELPVITNYGVSNSIALLDYNQDGETDILMGKTGDGSGSLSFYQGYRLQLLKNNGNRSFTDVSSAIQNNATTTGSWVVWFLPKDEDGDGDIDIVTADKWYNLQWRNDNGTFVKY